MCKRSGAQAVHPGYGFLSENPLLARACASAGITFIGPDASAMVAMGSKTAARDKMIAAGVPVVPGAHAGTLDELARSAQDLGYPVMLKPLDGNQGRGISPRLASEEELAAAWGKAERFGSLVVECYVEGRDHRVLVVNGKLPVKSVAEFVSYVKAQPSKLSYGSSGVGSVAHLAMALFVKRAGLDMTAVHYRGNAPALTDVVAGHMPTMFSTLADALPHAKSGAIRLLAVSGDRRASQVPDVPTVAEAAYPGYRVITWNGLMAPAQTPKTIVDRVAAEVARAVKDKGFAERLTKFGVDPLGNNPAEFSALIAAELRLWADAVEIAGVKAK